MKKTILCTIVLIAILAGVGYAAELKGQALLDALQAGGTFTVVAESANIKLPPGMTEYTHTVHPYVRVKPLQVQGEPTAFEYKDTNAKWTLNPHWSETFVYEVNMYPIEVEAVVMDWNLLEEDTKLGTVRFHVPQGLDDNLKCITKDFPGENGQVAGSLRLCFAYVPKGGTVLPDWATAAFDSVVQAGLSALGFPGAIGALAMWESFKGFLHRFAVEYVEGEYEKRFEHFVKNIMIANTLNEQYGVKVFGMTQFSDLTQGEFFTLYGFEPSDAGEMAKPADANANNNENGEIATFLSEEEKESGIFSDTVDRYLSDWFGAGARLSDWLMEQVPSLPENFDWRDKGKVTPVKNQGACGSCFTFAATAALESALAIDGKDLVSLSEQQLVDCDSSGVIQSNSGCCGGWSKRCFWYIVDSGGIMSATDYPYEMKDWSTGIKGALSKKAGFTDEKMSKEGFDVCDHLDDYDLEQRKTCRFDKAKAVATLEGVLFIDDFDIGPKRESLMASALVNIGPIKVSIKATGQTTFNLGDKTERASLFQFMDFSHPVDFDTLKKLGLASDLTVNGDKTSATEVGTNHAVVVVGIKRDQATKKDYWVVRNSWDNTWADGGYFYVERGYNLLGIGQQPVIPIVNWKKVDDKMA